LIIDYLYIILFRLSLTYRSVDSWYSIAIILNSIWKENLDTLGYGPISNSYRSLIDQQISAITSRWTSIRTLTRPSPIRKCIGGIPAGQVQLLVCLLVYRVVRPDGWLSVCPYECQSGWVSVRMYHTERGKVPVDGWM